MNKNQLTEKLFSGPNGVLVSTLNTYTDEKTFKKVDFYDKNVFSLQAQSHEYHVNGILCEQGE